MANTASFPCLYSIGTILLALHITLLLPICMAQEVIPLAPAGQQQSPEPERIEEPTHPGQAQAPETTAACRDGYTATKCSGENAKFATEPRPEPRSQHLERYA